MKEISHSITAERKQYLLFVFTLMAVVFAIVVVVLGAFTRLSDAGLGCPDWPGCYGHLMWPNSEAEVAAADARYPDMPVEHDKTWPEMVHRYFAGALGVIILTLTVLSFLWSKWQPSLPKKLPVFLCGLVVLQAAFGMWTVTLKLWPQVVTAHLMGGFATLSFLWLLAQRLSRWHWKKRVEHESLKKLSLFVLLLVIVQICLGGWTSSNYAALACVDLPTCHGVWWPNVDFAQGFNLFQHVGPNYLGGLLDNDARTAIHLTHRMGAIIVALFVLFLVFKLRSTGFHQERRIGVVLLLLLTIQVCLGVSNILWVLPLTVAVAHNAFGAILLLSLVTLNHRLFTAKQEG